MSGLPLLPGFSFNHMLGKTKFNLDPKFDFIGDGVPALVEKVKPKMFGALSDRYPSIFARGEVTELPPWIAFDKQVLSFDALLREEQPQFGSPLNIRRVKINLFLEDGTIQVVEPKIENSGVAQGTLICRHRIRFPGNMDDNYYDIIDFNIGRQIEFYGHVFKVIDCDRFTRTFLNRCGIAVPDPILYPAGATAQSDGAARRQTAAKKEPEVDSLGKFLANDKKVLRFYAHWDDRKHDYGILHKLEFRFYLANDTVEISEFDEVNGKSGVFLKRGPMPKSYRVRNFDTNVRELRFIKDTINENPDSVEYYQDHDLRIGNVVNCYGRGLILYDCDGFTKQYYATKFGLEFPESSDDDHGKKQKCNIIRAKTFEKPDKSKLDKSSNLKLRFQAKMISKVKENREREFVLSFQLSDNSIAIFEYGQKNSGFSDRQFFARSRVLLAPNEICPTENSKYYTPQHMFVGAIVVVNDFYFVLTNADEFSLKYMEDHSDQFPKSNIALIMSKVKHKVKPMHREFVGEDVPNEGSVISYRILRSKLWLILEDDFTEQEMITIARAFRKKTFEVSTEREDLREVVLNDIKRSLWDDHERLKEYFLGRDPNGSGKVSPQDTYNILRACRLPFDSEMIKKIVNVIEKDDENNINYNDLLNFINPNITAKQMDLKECTKKISEADSVKSDFIDWFLFDHCLNAEN